MLTWPPLNRYYCQYPHHTRIIYTSEPSDDIKVQEDIVYAAIQITSLLYYIISSSGYPWMRVYRTHHSCTPLFLKKSAKQSIRELPDCKKICFIG